MGWGLLAARGAWPGEGLWCSCGFVLFFGFRVLDLPPSHKQESRQAGVARAWVRVFGRWTDALRKQHTSAHQTRTHATRNMC